MGKKEPKPSVDVSEECKTRWLIKDERYSSIVVTKDDSSLLDLYQYGYMMSSNHIYVHKDALQLLIDVLTSAKMLMK